MSPKVSKNNLPGKKPPISLKQVHDTCMFSFCDLDPIFKVIVFLSRISFEPVDGFSRNFDRYIIVTSSRAG